MTRRPFDEVVVEHGPAVLRVIRSYLPPADADDAWSDTFLAAMRAYPDLRPGSNVRAWLLTVARNKAIDHIRTRNRAPLPMEEWHEVASTDGIPEPADEDLRVALGSLTPRQRDAVVYHHIGGLPYADVGALLGSDPAAARRSAADGIARLRKEYAERTGRRRRPP